MNEDPWVVAEWTRTRATATIRNWKRLLPFGPATACKAGRRLLQERSASRALFLIEDDIVKLTVNTPIGPEAVLMIRFPGDLLGGYSATLKVPEFVSAVAVTDCLISSVATPRASEVLKASADAASWLAERQTLDAVRMTLLLLQSRMLNAEQRLFRLLRDIAFVTGIASATDRKRVRLKLPVLEADVAQLVGVTPKSFSRLKKRLVLDGRLTQEGSAIFSFSLDEHEWNRPY